MSNPGVNARFLMAAAAVPLALFVAAATASSTPTDAPQLAQLWNAPEDLQERDLFHGPWGVENAPRPDATYTFVRPKEGGVNPGVVVRDEEGRTWHVKQSPTDDGVASSVDRQGAEGPVEVVLSRVLSAVGYHQPPVYYLPAFDITDATGRHRRPGGRFRLDDETLRDVGKWAWNDSPFAGTRPHNGLLVILLLFNSWDLKDSNNTLYEVKRGNASTRWFVVRDLGAALGETGRFNVWSRRWSRARRNDIEEYARHDFIEGVEDGFVRFNYHGRQPGLVRNRITVEDVMWATSLLARLTERQWRDAFRAGGYDADLGARFIAEIKRNIADARQCVSR